MTGKTNNVVYFKNAFWVVYISILVLLLTPGIYDLSVHNGSTFLTKILVLAFELLVLTGLLLSLLNVRFGFVMFWKLVHGIMLISVVLTLLTGLWLLFFVDIYVGIFTLAASVILMPAQWRLYLYTYRQLNAKYVATSGAKLVLPENYLLEGNRGPV